MGDKQREVPIGTLTLRIFPGYGEQVVLRDAYGKEIGTEIVGLDLDGYAVAVREAAANLIRDALPDIAPPSTPPVEPYRRVMIAPAELERGMLVEIGETGKVLGEVGERGVIGVHDTLIYGTWADGRQFGFRLDTGLWVRIPN